MFRLWYSKQVSRILFFIFISVCLILKTTAFAQPNNCKPVDLRSELGAIRNQQSTGWCYAFSLADVLGHRIGIRPPEMLSARDIATTMISYSEKDGERVQLRDHRILAARVAPFNGERITDRAAAHPFEAMIAYSNRGRICLESELPSQSVKYNVQWLNQKVNEVYQEYNWPANSVKSTPIDDIVQCYLAKPADLNLIQFQRQVNNFATENLRREADAICPETDKFKALNPTQIFRSNGATQSELMALGDEALNSGEPYIIDYDVNPWKKPLEIKSAEAAPGMSVIRNSEGRHASVVVGRRWNESKNQCELLIRNSWGPSCASYRQGTECIDGHFWASEEELMKHSHSVFKF